MPRVTYRSVSHRSTPSPVQENNFNYDRHPHARGDRSRPYPTLGSVMDRSATADPDDGFTDIGFRDFVQASRRVSRRKLARIETNPYASELLSRGVDVTHEPMETLGSILDTSVTHTNNVGTMLMDELAYAQTRIDTRKDETKKLEEWKETAQDIMHGQEDSIVRQSADIDLLKGEVTTLKDLVRALVTKTGELEDDKVRLTRRVSELTGEVRELQRRCSESEVRIEEEEPMIPYRAESPPARFVVPVEGRLVPVDDEVIEIGSDEFYQNLGVVRRDTPRPGRRMTPLITVTDYTQPRGRWPVQDFDPYAEFVPDSEPNSDTEEGLPNYEDLSDVDPNEIRQANWANEELVRAALEQVQRIRRELD
ncbi:hypothetical protein BJ322DRAFT_1017861 [Thelephora terrestris]|uniref:Uncharacterized protein n=1 Tax=Thelephora terrestris TaxID=56493 RepID=A0A9P6HN58_9AGAM|nr:hypothetical protein BJ322DRAFT_1017861 [Thelephora terrestris]